MKSMLVGIGLFFLGFGGIAAFSGGMPAALFGTLETVSPADDIAERQLVTLADYGEAAQVAYEQMLGACTEEDRKAFGRAMNALAVAKRHADTGKIERGNIGDRASVMFARFVKAVRKGVITNDHVPFGSLRTVVKSTLKNAATEEPQPEPMTFNLRGRIGEAAAAEHNDCQVL
jgi:hypothetical protein